MRLFKRRSRAAVTARTADAQSNGGASEALAVIQDDMSHVHFRITAAVAIAGVFFTQISLDKLRGQPDWEKGFSIAGLVCLLAAAGLYFQYTQQLNKLRLRIVGERLGSRLEPALQEWRDWLLPGQERRGEWAAWNIWYYRVGQVLLPLGSGCVGVALIGLLFDK